MNASELAALEWVVNGCPVNNAYPTIKKRSEAIETARSLERRLRALQAGCEQLAGEWENISSYCCARSRRNALVRDRDRQKYFEGRETAFAACANQLRQMAKGE